MKNTIQLLALVTMFMFWMLVGGYIVHQDTIQVRKNCIETCICPVVETAP